MNYTFVTNKNIEMGMIPIMNRTVETGNSALDQREYMTSELRLGGFIVIDECGHVHLTEKGRIRAGARLDKLPIGENLLLEIAICEAYSMKPNL
ncbi:hypothetical protein I6N90_02680 [Paenibacillus sp. GSMTC-2017]|uniref:hypothetical protein n=1 Tax=Paenibacillus sp. GSMTC-2017 TaxID=2794350 RepID=UPI0018DA1711|nr:hypothetical protein [Paenibacillus sp. GSMTC-2017]MBH5316714.1 hypothetical protein [Paenibacillus sp. GSMTC-2017]